jgi:hypothetical protein
MCGFKKEFRVMSFRQPSPAQVERMNPAVKLLTIPAGIDEKRRDYLTVISACTQVAREGKRFQLVLLGKCSPETLSTALSHALDEFSREFPEMLIRFADYVPNETFEAYMAASTCLIANLVPYVHAKDGTTEVSGVSKESGTRSLADERDMLCLKPHELPPGERPHNYLSYGSAEELAELLRNLL